MRSHMTALMPAEIPGEQVEHQGWNLLVTKLLRFDYSTLTSQIPILGRIWYPRVRNYFLPKIVGRGAGTSSE